MSKASSLLERVLCGVGVSGRHEEVTIEEQRMKPP